MCVCIKVSVFLSAGEFHLRVQCRKKRCGTAAWKCCRTIYPASLNVLLARSLSVLPSWELPSNSFTKESRNNLLSLRTRSVYTQMHVPAVGTTTDAEFLLELHCRQDVKYLAISGFFFLRFFAPAILTPKLFQLREQHADTRTSRTLLLLAKVHITTQAQTALWMILHVLTSHLSANTNNKTANSNTNHFSELILSKMTPNLNHCGLFSVIADTFSCITMQLLSS